MLKSNVEEANVKVMNEQKIPLTFVDKDGEEFKAKSDGILINSITNQLIIVEFKDGDCNKKGSIQASYNYLENQCRRLGLSNLGNHNALAGTLWSCNRAGGRNAYQKGSWSNALAKHAIVSKELDKHNIQFLMVYASHKPLVTYYGRQYQFQDFYRDKYELEVMVQPDFDKLVSDGDWVPFTGKLSDVI